MKYRTCPHCGAHLDYGEKCECQEKNSFEKLSQSYGNKLFKEIPGQIEFLINGREIGLKTA